MGIQKDAGELLTFIYEKKRVGAEMPQTNDLMQTTKWDKNRVVFALQYLIEKELIHGKVIRTVGSTLPVIAAIVDITSNGIDVMEDVDKFKKNFNFTVNLGFVQYSWGAQEA